MAPGAAALTVAMVASRLTSIRFGAFEGYPVRFTDNEAWELVDGKWHPSPSESYVVDILFGAHSLDEDTFRAEFGDVPPLPEVAFSKASQSQ